MKIKLLADCLEQLNDARKRSPQEQRDVVVDLARRGFLQQVMRATALGLSAGVCGHQVFATGIDGLPDIGDSDRTNLSPTQASELGRDIILDINAQGMMQDDYDCLDYLNSVGGNLVSYSPLAGQPFSFYLIKDKMINAFALPGGYICLNNGLVYSTLSEAELSSVMSHEIGHIVQHHVFRNISVSNRGQWSSIAGLIAGAILAPINPGAAMVAAQSGQGLATQNWLSNSRDYEREADRVGQQLMYSAGYDAHAMPEFFQRMQDAYKFNSNDALAFLQTHPVTMERLSEAESRANQLPVKMREDSTDFLLVREKCRIRQLNIDEAIKFYYHAIATHRYVSLSAQQYGLALSYFLNKQLSLSISTLNKLSEPAFQRHPIVLGLRARQLIASGNVAAADRIYDQALTNYPNHKGLWMGQIEFLLAIKNYAKAARRLDDLAQSNASDPDVWDQYAVLYSDGHSDNPLRYHYGLGTELYYLGGYSQALDQYQAALKAKPSKPGDGEIQDVISSKLPDLITRSKNS